MRDLTRVSGYELSDSVASISRRTRLLADFHPSSDNTSKCLIPFGSQFTRTSISARFWSVWFSRTYSRSPMYPPLADSRTPSRASIVATTSSAVLACWPYSGSMDPIAYIRDERTIKWKLMVKTRTLICREILSTRRYRKSRNWNYRGHSEHRVDCHD